MGCLATSTDPWSVAQEGELRCLARANTTPASRERRNRFSSAPTN